MPNYDLYCSKCDNTLEKNILYNELLDNIKCEVCGNRLVVMIKSTNFILKGRGWSKDNYNKEEGKK